jgi:hypothetical protein
LIVFQLSYEKPSSAHTATLYYFAGRGLADQIRWMLAAANIEFTQKVISIFPLKEKESDSQFKYLK